MAAGVLPLDPDGALLEDVLDVTGMIVGAGKDRVLPPDRWIDELRQRAQRDSLRGLD